MEKRTDIWQVHGATVFRLKEERMTPKGSEFCNDVDFRVYVHPRDPKREEREREIAAKIATLLNEDEAPVVIQVNEVHKAARKLLDEIRSFREANGYDSTPESMFEAERQLVHVLGKRERYERLAQSAPQNAALLRWYVYSQEYKRYWNPVLCVWQKQVQFACSYEDPAVAHHDASKLLKELGNSHQLKVLRSDALQDADTDVRLNDPLSVDQTALLAGYTVQTAQGNEKRQLVFYKGTLVGDAQQSTDGDGFECLHHKSDLSYDCIDTMQDAVDQVINIHEEHR